MHSITFQKIIDEAPIITAAAFSLLFAALVLRFCILPLYSTSTFSKREYTYYIDRISSENNYAAIKQDILSKIDSLKVKTDFVSGLKESDGDISIYLENLITIARTLEIRFARVQPQQEKKVGAFSHYPILLAFSSSYHELGLFIAEIEKLPHLYRIDRLALDAASGNTCDVKLLVTSLIPSEKNND